MGPDRDVAYTVSDLLRNDMKWRVNDSIREVTNAEW